MGEKKLENISVSEYLLLEDQAESKNEYENGRIVAMSGGTLNHGIIGNNTNTAVSNAVREKNLECVSINGDVKIFIEKANSFVYPDGMLICGAIETFV